MKADEGVNEIEFGEVRLIISEVRGRREMEMVYVEDVTPPISEDNVGVEMVPT